MLSSPKILRPVPEIEELIGPIAGKLGAIAYRNKANEVISGTWSACSNQLSNESLSACWIKTPWLTWSSGNVSFDIKLSAKNGNRRGVVVRMIPYNAADANYEGTYSDTIFTITIRSLTAPVWSI